jgi:hypothetical protein
MPAMAAARGFFRRTDQDCFLLHHKRYRLEDG